jgi:hypothetical protein
MEAGGWMRSEMKRKMDGSRGLDEVRNEEENG